MASPPLYFADAADALGMADNPVPLRNWLRRGQVKIEGGFGGGWATFTFRDLAGLSIIAALVQNGVRLERANRLVRYAFKQAWRPEFDADPALATTSGSGFIADASVKTGLPSHVFVWVDHRGKDRITWGNARTRIDADTWLVIDAHRGIARVMKRAVELLNEQQAEPRSA